MNSHDLEIRGYAHGLAIHGLWIMDHVEICMIFKSSGLN
jgi:hypothetical protein